MQRAKKINHIQDEQSLKNLTINEKKKEFC